MPAVISAGGKVYKKFTTRAFATGVPTTLAGTPVVSIYKNDSLTQSTAGVTLTVDFDNVTGLNHVTIDTSADGTFYANGSTFYLVITTGTVGGTSVVGEVVGDFDLAASIASQVWDEINTGATHNIANSTGKQLRSIASNTGVIYGPATAPSQAGMTSTQIKLDSGASAVNQAYQWDIISIISGTGAGESAVITNYVGSTKVATVDSAWVLQPDNTSVFEITPTAQVQVISYVAGQDPGSLVLVTAANKLATSAAGGVTLADGVAHGGTLGSSTATLALKSVNVTNPSGASVIITSTGSNGCGVQVTGNGTGPAVALYGGTDSQGLMVLGGTNAEGFYCSGGKDAVVWVGGPNSGASQGHQGAALVLVANSGSTDTAAMEIMGVGSASVRIFGPATTSAPAILIDNASTNVYGSAGGDGLSILVDGSGHKALLLAGDAATDALAIAAGAGTPADVFNADGSVNVGNVLASALAEFFTTNSGKLYADAVAGSVVKEIVSNAGGSGITAADVWNEVLTSYAIPGSAGQVLRLINPNSSVIYSSTLPSQSGVPANQVKLDSGASSANGAYVGDVLSAVAGTGQGGGVCISYIGSTRTATINRNWPVQPVGGDTVEVTPTGLATVAGYVSGTEPDVLVWTATVRTLTDFGFTVTIGALPPIPTNWITANGINAGALNGKGDWPVGKTGYSLDLTQVLSAPRNLSAVADGSLTTNDAFHCAIAGAAGKESIVGTIYTVMTPATGTTIRVFTLDSGTAPKVRN